MNYYDKEFIDFIKEYLNRLDEEDKLVIFFRYIGFSGSKRIYSDVSYLSSKYIGLSYMSLKNRFRILKNYFTYLYYYKKYGKYLHNKFKMYLKERKSNKIENGRLYEFFSILVEDPYRRMSDIAKMMNLKTSTIYVMFHRVKKFFKDNMDDKIIYRLYTYLFRCAGRRYRNDL